MKKKITLPRPSDDSPVHSLIYFSAHSLRKAGATFQSARKALHGWRDYSTFREGRVVHDNELDEALRSVYGQPKGRCSGSNAKQAPQWPKANPEKRSKLIASKFGLADLRALSPVQFTDGKQHTREILEALFPGDPLVSCGWTTWSRVTRKLSEWESPEEMQLIVPSPMSAKYGARKKDGAASGRTLANTGPRRFLVIDFDDYAGADVHASASWYLKQKYPLALVLHSGGKSLHAWYYVEGVADDELRPFMVRACELAGDPALWTRSQFCRMPDGLRDNGNRQEVHYFAPQVCN